jgi:hypothetical protein
MGLIGVSSEAALILHEVAMISVKAPVGPGGNPGVPLGS